MMPVIPGGLSQGSDAVDVSWGGLSLFALESGRPDAGEKREPMMMFSWLFPISLYFRLGREQSRKTITTIP